MRFARLLMLLAAAGAIQAQTVAWDNSGNGMLSGRYYFRQVYYVIGDQYGDLSEAVTIYGNITFDGNGNYSIVTTDNAQYLDASGSGYKGGAFTTTGTYSIAASGYGFISSPYATGDKVYGLVSSQGIFVGSSTDNTFGYNDLMVAAPLASPVPTASSFTGSWSCADFDLSSAQTASALSLQFVLSPDGNGNLNAGIITGYSGSGTGTQTGSGLKYTFSNGAAVATFPVNGALISGQKYLYFSKDGNFMFGGSPVTSNTPFDFIVGVKTTANPTLSGLYYQAGIDDYAGDLDTYFGSYNVIAGAAPQTFLGHERINDFGGSSVYDYTYDDTISLSGNTFSNSYAKYIVGAGGSVEITAGIGPYLGLSVGLQAPTPTGTGVFLDPTRVVNAGSSAPFTAGIAPGELLTMYGSNLAPPGLVVAPVVPLPTSLGNVQVTIGGFPAAIYYVSPGQIAAIVPYEVTVGSIVQIQVNNNGTLSNVVTNYVANTAPGVFTQNQNGTGYGEIEHLGIGNSAAPAGSLVTDANPAVAGETLSVYLTGLGAVSLAVADGAAGPSGTLSQTTNTITVDFNGTAGTNDFAGLSPGYSALYQLNMTVPTGLTNGPNFLDISGPDAYMGYLLIPIGTATASSSETANVRTPANPIPAKFRKREKQSPAIRRE